MPQTAFLSAGSSASIGPGLQAGSGSGQLTGLGVDLVSRAYAGQALSARSMLPEPFTASMSQSALGTPMHLDYSHLVFWFFFLGAFVAAAWLLYTAVTLTRYTEARRPVRETRGFSRAQTGDVMTAVLPMSWSVTMLMHASAHSSNFDENTTGTAFAVTIVAYQWGGKK